MISKQKIKFLNALKEKKYRQINQLFLAEGNKIVLDTLEISPHLIEQIYATEKWLDDNILNINLQKVKEIHHTGIDELKKISSFKTIPEVVAVLRAVQHEIIEDELASDLSLVLDTIQDPGNLGNIIRVANWFGIENIICSPESADCYNPKVVQATMGAILRVRVHYTNLEQFLKKMKSYTDFKIYGAFLDGTNVYNTKLSSKGAIVMGNESKGINDTINQYVDRKLFIPSFNNRLNTIESLNVAAATAIICSEFRRRAD